MKKIVFAVIAWLCCMLSTRADEPRPEKVLQTGHTTEVVQVAWAHDGKTLASIGASNEIRLWDVESYELRAVLSGHRDEVHCITWTPDGSTLVAAIGDGTLVLWNVQHNQKVLTIRAHIGAVYAVAISPDGKRIASGGEDGSVKLWDFDGKLRRDFILAPNIGVSSLAFSPDGSTLACGGGFLWTESDSGRGIDLNSKTAGRVTLFEAATGRVKKFLSGHEGAVNALAFSPSGNLLLTGSEDTTARLWDFKTGKLNAILRSHVLRITGVAFSPDGKTIWTGSDDATIKKWDVASARGLQTFKPRQGQNYSVAVSPNGSTLASGSTDYCVRLWNTQDGAQKHSWSGAKNSVEALWVSPQSDEVIASYWHWRDHRQDHPDGDYDFKDESALRFWNLKTGLLRLSVKPEDESGVPYNLIDLGNGQTLIDDSLRIWNREAGKVVGRLQLQGDSSGGNASSLALSPNYKYLAIVTADSDFGVWAMKGGKPVWKTSVDIWDGLDQKPLSFSPDGKFLAVAFQRRFETTAKQTTVRNQVEIWEAACGKLIRQLPLKVERTLALTWSPDGSTLASGNRDGSLYFWNAPGFGKSDVVKISHREINEVVWSPDGKTLAAASDDGTIYLLDASTRTVRSALRGHTSWVLSIQFTLDGAKIVSGGTDHCVRIWSVNGTQLLATLTPLPGTAEKTFDNWIAYTPEGYYTGSKDCEKYIRWRMNDVLFSAEKYKEQFHRPDLVQKALN